MEPFKQPESIGRRSFVVPRNIIATVLDITVTSWIRVQSTKIVSATSHETEIAGYLGREMIKEKNQRPGLENQLRIEEEVGTRSSFTIVKPDGRIDIKIIYSFNESEYFGIECKRVAGGGSRSAKKLAQKYVADGVMRFVIGKYSPDHDWAAMIGFVLKGEISDCIKLIRNNLTSTKIDTCIEEDWSPEDKFGYYKDIYRTGHRQKDRATRMTILHLFLAIK